VSSRESRVTGHGVTGQLTDGSRGSRVKKCDHCHLWFEDNSFETKAKASAFWGQ